MGDDPNGGRGVFAVRLRARAVNVVEVGKDAFFFGHGLASLSK
jgi:hypothetical protein